MEVGAFGQKRDNFKHVWGLPLKENMVENSAEISSKCAVCPQIMSLTPNSFGTQSNDIRECVMKF